MSQPYDASSKWLIQTHADSILRLAGITGVQSWTALPGELVQSRQLPDGLIEAKIEGHADPVLFLIEINTYPDNRISKELLDDLLLTYLNRRQVPELMTLVLQPKGRVRIPDRLSVPSPLNGSEISVRWRVIELWTFDFESFMPNPEPGIVPWLMLTRMSEPAESGLKQLRESLDRVSEVGEKANLLAITQILGGLQYDYDMLKALFGQEGKMIESPFLVERDRRVRVASHKQLIKKQLSIKFGNVPEDISNAIADVDVEDELMTLGERLMNVNTLDEFRSALPK